MNTHQIILGDCIEGMKTLSDKCVQTCITSPPYFGLRAYNGGDEEIGQEETVDEYVQKMVEVFREVRRILRDDGTLWLNLGDSYMSAKNCVPPPQTVGGQRGMPSDFIPANRKNQKGLKNKDLIGIPWRVAFALQADGWYLRQDIIWHKPNPMPESVEDRCTRAHEYIFMFSKKSHYHYDHEAIKEDAVGVPHSPGNKNVTQPKEKGARDPGLDPDRVWASDGKKNKRSVWTVNTKGYKGAHFAVYPETLITPCVLAGCPQDGTVFDPFTGSGTTAVVALRHGRNYIGTELNPEYVQIAENRIAESVPQSLSDFLA
jgi:DNA modification methylase